MSRRTEQKVGFFLAIMVMMLGGAMFGFAFCKAITEPSLQWGFATLLGGVILIKVAWNYAEFVLRFGYAVFERAKEMYETKQD